MKMMLSATALCWLWAVALGAAEPRLAIDLGQGVTLDMVLVPKGDFRQGSPPDESGRKADEAQREVTLTADFYLGKYPVTVGQFRRFVEETRFRTEAESGPSGGFGFDGKQLVQRRDFTWRKPGFPQTDEHPVTIVSVADAHAFCTWLSRKAQRAVTLPTEAQWEYACRAGTTTSYYLGSGESALQRIGWYLANSAGGTHPVGQKEANRFGLCDMCGQVYEWCRDVYGPYEGSAVKDPVGTKPEPGNPPRNVLRGGSWMKEARSCRSAARYRNSPGSRNADNGFRVAMALTPAAAKASPPVAEALPPEGPPAASPSAGSPKSPASTPPKPPAPPVQRRSSRPRPAPDISFGGLFCMGLACVCITGIIAALAVFLFKQIGRRPDAYGPRAWAMADQQGGQIPAPSRLHAESADDGFWLPVAGLTAGAVIHYRCLVDGALRDSTVTVESGDRQFVYTGGRPGQITVVDIGGVSSEPSAPLPAVGMPFESSDRSPPPATDKFRGFPSAY